MLLAAHSMRGIVEAKNLSRSQLLLLQKSVVVCLLVYAAVAKKCGSLIENEVFPPHPQLWCECSVNIDLIMSHTLVSIALSYLEQ